jgi:hypothetical protein
MDIRHIARVCHEVNAAYCRSLGDTSQLPWDQAPQWQRDSAVAGVKFLIDNPNAGPGATHASWLALKRAGGWVYGPVKDPATKRHPCMVPFTELPEAQQTKDHLFVATVRACQYDYYIQDTALRNNEALLSIICMCHKELLECGVTEGPIEQMVKDIIRDGEEQKSLIKEMNDHEGAEGWSEDLKRRIKEVLS